MRRALIVISDPGQDLTALTAKQANQRAWISLGSNLGPSRRILSRAMRAMEALSAAPLVRSSIRRTRPVDCPPGSPPFCNAVVGLKPRAGETPGSLLTQLQQLEWKFGRRRSGTRNEPRRLDLDLIAFQRRRAKTRRLSLPHPRAHERLFVLEPLAELAPRYVLPGRRRTVWELLRALQAR